ncbi:MAG: D-amino acid dehydrogenase [Caenispirillum bisanense]|nr:D-amino acid dehydrogenase [Caenispirillum bisanense]MCA1972860.1 D-amino acid dehydrogenase [Caenispirillum sp.]
MKIVILGSGVVGVTTAWFLARDGHEVTVLDRQPAPAMETSFANAGEISPGYATPWAAPGIPMKAIKWMFMRHAPLVLHARMDPDMWRWMGMMLRNCTAARYEVNKSRMVRVAEYSRDVLKWLRGETGISYDERTRGTLEVFRTQAALDGIAKDTAILDRYGVPYEVLDTAGCARYEPALGQVSEKIVGGLLLPGDETGDCFKFTQALAKMAADLGVQFRHGVTIKTVTTEGDRVTGVETDQGRVTADSYLCAMGSYSPLLLKTLGISVPVYPVKGYSITIPVENEAGAPVSTVMDEAHKVALTRLGDRIRVAGMAELNGYNLELDQRRRETVEYVVSDLFPTGGDVAKSEFWTGLRPMTPDSVPVMGPTRYRNLMLNTGHGTLGWTMACGSARVLTDLYAGRTPDIDMDGLTIARFGGTVTTPDTGRAVARPDRKAA